MTAGFELLRRRYGALWMGSLESAGWASVKEAALGWVRELAEVPPEVLGRAFEGWREPKPPSLMELRGRCLGEMRIRPEHQVVVHAPRVRASDAEKARVSELLKGLREVLG